MLERQQAGELSTRHVRAVAETVGVSERTVWRWLEEAKSAGRMEAGVRQGYAVGATGSSLNPAVEVNAVSVVDRVDQGPEFGGWVR
ncbi:helix-turn-helix domain-containing protein, partial [Streptomyces sp. NPDC002676]